jgi:hypothetical protein
VHRKASVLLLTVTFLGPLSVRGAAQESSASPVRVETKDIGSWTPPLHDAKSCSNIDNRNAVLARVRDQGESGWCFAYVAADLLSYKLGVPVSAVDVALNYVSDPKVIRENRKYQKPDPFGTEWSGDVGPALAIESKGVGVCPEQFLRSDEYYFAGLSDPSFQTVSYTEENFDKDQRVAERHWITAAFDNLAQATKAAGKTGNLSQQSAQQIEDVFANFDPQKFQHLLQQSKSTEDINHWLRQTSCDGHRLKIPAGWTITTVEVDDDAKTGASLIPIIDQQLLAKNIVGVGWHHLNGVLSSAKKREDALDAIGDKSRGIPPDEDGDDGHSSSIVARRFNTKNEQCEYLIRNSWGPNCYEYNTDKYTCDEGNVWVNEKDLGPMLTDLEYLH